MARAYKFTSTYKGPKNLAEDAEAAIAHLGSTLSVTSSECASHSLLIVDCFGDEPCLEATAIYLVSAIAQSVTANLRIRAALFDEKNIKRDLANDIDAVIGSPTADEEFKTKRRDPWLWEGISHMLLHLSRSQADFHPSGEVLVKTAIKHDVHDHGLDIIALYQGDSIGITAGECKAYLTNPSRGITDASSTLSEVDSNIRDIEIRAAVNQLRFALPDSAMDALAGSFWRDEKTYFPFVCCDTEHAPDWRKKRKSLGKLGVPVSRKFLTPLAIVDARATFDKVCKMMSAYPSL